MTLAAGATAATFAFSALFAATPAPDPEPPSIAQLCAATGIAEVDDLLRDAAATDLVGELSPLVTLLVPDSDTVELDASVQLDDVRNRLNCAPGTTTPETTPPTLAPDDDGFSQLDDGPPVGAAATGGGPAA